MIFIDKFQNLLNKYESSSCGVMDKAILYGLCHPAPPLAKHIVFEPLSERDIKRLIDDYKRSIPEELLTIYRFMNGADLFWTVRKIGKNNRIPVCRLSIYGVPSTTDRKHLEPFNIRIEDLNRPNNAPEGWLKFGSYVISDDINVRYGLFVDTETFYTFAIKSDCSECHVERSWISIDACLCCLLDEQLHTE